MSVRFCSSTRDVCESTLSTSLPFGPRTTTAPCGAPGAARNVVRPWKKFSKVSALVYLLHKVTRQRTFENFLPWVVASRTLGTRLPARRPRRRHAVKRARAPRRLSRSACPVVCCRPLPPAPRAPAPRGHSQPLPLPQRVSFCGELLALPPTCRLRRLWCWLLQVPDQLAGQWFDLYMFIYIYIYIYIFIHTQTEREREREIEVRHRPPPPPTRLCRP
jgi:hypothetical protein